MNTAFPGGPAFLSTQVSDGRYYFLDLEPAARAGLRVVCGGCERCNPEYRIDRRRFPYQSIEYVVKGRGEVRLAGRAHRLQAATAFAYGPGVPHAIRNDPADPMVKYFVDFAGREAAGLLARSPLRDGVVPVAAPGEIQDVFEDLQRHGSRERPEDAAICAVLVRLLVLKIGALAMPAGSADSRARATYQRCRQVIERQFMALRTMEEAARACRVDPAYLCRLFARFDRLTPYQCLVRLKMNRAAELLVGSGQLVKEVAGAMGFADPYHFSRVFKGVHHLSPAQFLRRAARGGRVVSAPGE